MSLTKLRSESSLVGLDLAISLALVFPRRGEIKFSVGSIIAIKKEEPKSFSM